MKRKSILASCLATIMLTFSPTNNVNVNAQTNNENPAEENPAMVVDALNGQILYEEATEELVEVGDLTKLLTLYIVYSEIQSGTIALDTTVPISDKAFAVSQDYGINNVPLRQDYPYTVEQLMEAVVISSANGATIALAELIATDEAAFVTLMEQQLNSWHIENYNLINSTGLPADYMADIEAGVPVQEETEESDLASDAQLDESKSTEPTTSQSGENNADESDSSTNQSQATQNNQTLSPTSDNTNSNQLTSEAVATIAYHLINDFPQILEWSTQSNGVFVPDTSDAFDMTNANEMLAEEVYSKSKVEGLMVDDSQEESTNIVSTTKRNDFRLIAVVLDAEDEEEMYNQAGQLFDQSYSSFTLEHVAKQGDELNHIGTIEVLEGVQPIAPLVYQEDFSVILPIIDTAPQLNYNFIPDYEYFTIYDDLIAPIEAGTQVGVMEVTANQPEDTQIQSKNLDSATGNRAKVIVAEDIESAPWYLNAWRNTTNAIGNAWEATRTFFTNLFN